MRNIFISAAITLVTLVCGTQSYAQYCAPSGGYAGNNAKITNVTIAGGGLNNSNSYNGAGYQDLTAITYTAIVYSQEVHTISVTRTLDAASPYSVKIWIDYDDDGNFTNSTTASEEVAALTDGDTISTVTFNRTVPDSVVIGGVKKSTYGIHRMRVRNVYTANSNAANMSPCGFYQYSEAEDYLITIKANALLVQIPDSNFVKWLQKYYQSAMVGDKMDTTNAAVVNAVAVSPETYEIADLTGIKYFKNMITLYCHKNKLKTFPELPKKIKSLYCGENQLTSLPEIPTLELLDCHNNQLTNLPYYPKLGDLNCSGNNISALPPLKDTMYAISIVGNAGITCLPPVKVILTTGERGILYSGTGITCFPNRITHPNSPSMPGIDTLPICNTTNNPNSCVVHCNAQFSLHPDVTTPHHWFALDESWGKSPLGYSWTWGDGGNSSGVNASHTYSSAGYFKICLTITDDTTCTSTFCDSSTYISRMDEDNAIISVDVVSSLPTAVNTVTDKHKALSIYPNPVGDKLTVGNWQLANGELEIENMLGQLIKYQAASNKYQDKMEIDVSRLPQGIYFIKDIKTGEIAKFAKE